MRKLYVCALLLLAGFAGLLIPAKAQAQDRMLVNIPFQFVAAGQTLPAGEYKISRLSDRDPRILLLSSRENPGDTIMLLPESKESANGHAKLDFATVGDQHVLSRIETGSNAYSLAVPRAEAALLAAAPRKGVSVSSASGSN